MNRIFFLTGTEISGMYLGSNVNLQKFGSLDMEDFFFAS